MDTISNELQNFLVKLGKQPDCVSERAQHQVKHILHLLPLQDEKAVKQYYGLFGTRVHSLNEIAKLRVITTEEMEAVIKADLRKLAITPEWQMIKQFIKDDN